MHTLRVLRRIATRFIILYHQKEIDQTYAAVSRYFINGILAGGLALAAAKIPLESALGTSIFDTRAASSFRLGQGISRGLFSANAAAVYVPSALWGMSVGFGTKVSSEKRAVK
jgi:hypothetical protein